jgi:hypothetical protein
MIISGNEGYFDFIATPGGSGRTKEDSDNFHVFGVPGSILCSKEFGNVAVFTALGLLFVMVLHAVCGMNSARRQVLPAVPYFQT